MNKLSDLLIKTYETSKTHKKKTILVMMCILCYTIWKRGVRRFFCLDFIFNKIIQRMMQQHQKSLENQKQQQQQMTIMQMRQDEVDKNHESFILECKQIFQNLFQIDNIQHNLKQKLDQQEKELLWKSFANQILQYSCLVLQNLQILNIFQYLRMNFYEKFPSEQVDLLFQKMIQQSLETQLHHRYCEKKVTTKVSMEEVIDLIESLRHKDLKISKKQNNLSVFQKIYRNLFIDVNFVESPSVDLELVGFYKNALKDLHQKGQFIKIQNYLISDIFQNCFIQSFHLLLQVYINEVVFVSRVNPTVFRRRKFPPLDQKLPKSGVGIPPIGPNPAKQQQKFLKNTPPPWVKMLDSIAFVYTQYQLMNLFCVYIIFLILHIRMIILSINNQLSRMYPELVNSVKEWLESTNFQIFIYQSEQFNFSMLQNRLLLYYYKNEVTGPLMLAKFLPIVYKIINEEFLSNSSEENQLEFYNLQLKIGLSRSQTDRFFSGQDLQNLQFNALIQQEFLNYQIINTIKSEIIQMISLNDDILQKLRESKKRVLLNDLDGNAEEQAFTEIQDLLKSIA